MATIRDVVYRWTIEADEAEQGAEDVQKAVKKTDSEVNSLTKSLKKLGAAFLAGFSIRAVVNFAKASLTAYDRQIKAQRSLEVALGRTSKALLDQADAIQKNTTLGNEEVIAQQAFLASLGFTEDKIKDIITASVDLSAATQQSLDFAVRNLAKTYSGLTGELGELIPSLKDFTVEELKAGAATEYATEQFKGQAEELAKVGLGPVQQFQNAFGDFQKEVGEGLTPTVSASAKVLKFFVEQMDGGILVTELFKSGISQIIPAFTQLIGVINVAGSALNAFSDEPSLFDRQVESFREFIKVGNPTQEEFKKIAFEVGKAGIALDDTEAVMEFALKTLFEMRKTTKGATEDQKEFNDELDDTKTILTGTIAFYEAVKGKLEEQRKNTLATSESWAVLNRRIKEVEFALETFGSGIDEIESKGLFDPDGDLANAGRPGGTLESLGDSMIVVADQMGDAKISIEDVQHAMGELGVVIQQVGQIWGDLSHAFTASSEIRLNKLDEERDKAIANAGESTGAIERINKEFDEKVAAERKKLAEQNQAAAIVSSLVNTALSVTQTLAQLGFTPIGIAAAIAAGAAGAAQTAVIASQQFKEGGFTPMGNDNDAVGIVHANEYVANAGIVRKAKPFFRALDRGQLSPEVLNQFVSRATLSETGVSFSDSGIIRATRKNTQGITGKLDQLLTAVKSKGGFHSINRRR